MAPSAALGPKNAWKYQKLWPTNLLPLEEKVNYGGTEVMLKYRNNIFPLQEVAVGSLFSSGPCAATTILPLTEKRYYKRCSLAFSHFFYFPIFTSTLQKAMASACFLSSYYMDCNLLIRNSFVYYYCKADTQSFLFLLANLKV